MQTFWMYSGPQDRYDRATKDTHESVPWTASESGKKWVVQRTEYLRGINGNVSFIVTHFYLNTHCISWSRLECQNQIQKQEHKRWTFRRLRDLEQLALMNRISALGKETTESSFAPSTMWGHSKKGPSLKNSVDTRLYLLVPWSWTFHSLELWAIYFTMAA